MIVAALERIDDGRMPVAEVNRRLGAVAEHLGVPRPSYEQVRRMVRACRAGKRGPSTGLVLLEIACRARPPDALIGHMLGDLRPL